MRSLLRRTLSSAFGPWRSPRNLWNSGAYVCLGLPVGIVGFTVVITLLAIAFGLLITFFLAVPFAWLTFESSRIFAALERSRSKSLLGLEIPNTVPPLVRPTFLGRLGERVGSGRRWTEIGHSLLALVTGSIGFSLIAVAWGGSVALAGLPAYVGSLPNEQAEFWLFSIGDLGSALLVASVGLVGLAIVAPFLTLAVSRGQFVLAKAMLGGSREAELTMQLGRLETRRAAAVDTAENERRRIERDLHDGAQQRLVALAANLGAARDKLDSDPESSRQLVVEAHEEAKAALREIRDLVRGIHPVILEDRGLDAALSAVVARSPVPVALAVDVAKRPPAAIESAAYFIVSECLTNVARHANASSASLDITRAGDRLVIEIRDDGVGGADETRGSGLRGLHDRVTALAGTMYVLSPIGGPTTISVELPCGS